MCLKFRVLSSIDLIPLLVVIYSKTCGCWSLARFYLGSVSKWDKYFERVSSRVSKCLQLAWIQLLQCRGYGIAPIRFRKAVRPCSLYFKLVNLPPSILSEVSTFFYRNPLKVKLGSVECIGQEGEGEVIVSIKSDLWLWRDNPPPFFTLHIPKVLYFRDLAGSLTSFKYPVKCTEK